MERTRNMCQSMRTSWPCYRRTALGTTSWTNHLHLVREYTTSFQWPAEIWPLMTPHAKQVRDICLKCSYRVKKTKSVHPSDEATHNINVYIHVFPFECLEYGTGIIHSTRIPFLGNYISYILIPEKTSSFLLPNCARCRARVGE